MGLSTREVLYYLVHLGELRSIIQWSTWHMPPHERDPEKESDSLKRCFFFLDKTSRSFSTVIKELHPELLVPVALYYLILRGLDTIEDDMTIPLETKEPLLRNFHSIIVKDGWNFDGNGAAEKDRQLLVEFNVVIEEFNKIKPAYQEIIIDSTKQMGHGMADYCNNAEHNINGVSTIKEYDLYCHHVAGLVGEGLTRMFVEGKLANPVLLDRPKLHESMGRFLQKINIIRDVHEDFQDKRRFWPKEIWSKYVDKFEDLFEPENLDAALNCSSDMVLNALDHVDDCLFYLAGLKEQSVFNFCAIPQSMAIATLELTFRNPQLFKKNIKITKGQACRIMTDSTQNLRIVCSTFRRFTRAIHAKNTPRDPNFLKISIACGKIEQFIESIYPTQNPEAMVRQQNEKELQSSGQTDAEKAAATEAKWDTIYVALAVLGTLVIVTVLMIAFAWFLGARFDIAAAELAKGNLRKPSPEQASAKLKIYDAQHTDL